VLTFLLSLPFNIFNVLAHLNIVGKPEMGVLYIALFTATPIVAASLLTFRRRGRRGLKELLGRALDFKRIVRSRWYLVILLLPPLILQLSITCLALSGAPIPPPLAPLHAFPVVCLLFFLMATGEEVGWMGYAFEPMQAERGALQAAFVLGIVWAFWHVPSFVFQVPDPVGLNAQILTLVGTRVLIAWIFNNTGRTVLAATPFHASDNKALVTLPEITAITPWGAALRCGIVGAAAVVLTELWGRRRFVQ
jgi:membrane protease YdiL (CAAX protease family)